MRGVKIGSGSWWVLCQSHNHLIRNRLESEWELTLNQGNISLLRQVFVRPRKGVIPEFPV